MHAFQTTILITFLILTLHAIAIANDWVWTDSGYIMNWDSGNLQISDTEWSIVDELRSYNNVNTSLLGGGSVHKFWMYDNSELLKYDGSLTNLYLYDNATASFLGGTSPMEIYVDPANTGWVKFYATNVSYGQGGIVGNWLSNNDYFYIQFTGDTYSHVQIVPEPASLLFFGLGSLAIFRRQK